jgi:hypothetical protein
VMSKEIYQFSFFICHSRIQLESAVVLLLSLTPGFSQVSGDAQLTLKPFKRFLSSAWATITWLKPGVNES